MEQVKKIIVPTDFSVRSLTILKEIVSEADDKDVFEVVLLHGVYPPTSITDLLFIHPAKYIRELETPEFKEACEVVKNKFQSRIRTMFIDIITSESKSYFNRYADRNKIDCAYVPKGLRLDFSGRNSFDVVSLILKSKIEVTEIQMAEQNIDVKFNNNIADLFLSGENLS